MNKKEKQIIKEILNIIENNPAGFYEDDEFDEDDNSPEDSFVFDATCIRKKCLCLLNRS